MPELKVLVAEATSAMLGLTDDPEEWEAEDYKKALDETFGAAASERTSAYRTFLQSRGFPASSGGRTCRKRRLQGVSASCVDGDSANWLIPDVVKGCR